MSNEATDRDHGAEVAAPTAPVRVVFHDAGASLPPAASPGPLVPHKNTLNAAVEEELDLCRDRAWPREGTTVSHTGRGGWFGLPLGSDSGSNRDEAIWFRSYRPIYSSTLSFTYNAFSPTHHARVHTEQEPPNPCFMLQQ